MEWGDVPTEIQDRYFLTGEKIAGTDYVANHVENMEHYFSWEQFAYADAFHPHAVEDENGNVRIPYHPMKDGGLGFPRGLGWSAATTMAEVCPQTCCGGCCASPPATPPAPPPPVLPPSNTGCYEYVAGYSDWDDARADCQSRGSELASIHSDEQNAAAVAARAAAGGIGHTWIGLKRIAPWVAGSDYAEWSDGSDYGYTNWNSGEPNGAGNTPCVWMRKNDGEWNDEHCVGESSWVGGHLCNAPCPSPPATAADATGHAADATGHAAADVRGPADHQRGRPVLHRSDH